MKITRQQLKNIIKESIQPSPLKESNEHQEKLILNDMLKSDNVEAKIQARELIDAIYGNQPPLDLNIYSALENDGEVLLDNVTYHEASIYHHQDKNVEPCDQYGNPTPEPTYDPEYHAFLYKYKY